MRQPHHLVGVGLAAVVLAAFGWLARQARAGRLPARQAQAVRQLGGVSVWLALFPYLLVAAQRGAPPERALLYKEQFLLLLAALVLRHAWQGAAGAGRRAWRWGLAGGVGLFAASQLALTVHREISWRATIGWPQAMPGAAWLAAHPRGPVLAPRAVNQLLLRFYLHQMQPQQCWQIDDYPHPGVRYRYYVGRPGEPVTDDTPLPVSAPLFTNPFLTIHEFR